MKDKTLKSLAGVRMRNSDGVMNRIICAPSYKGEQWIAFTNEDTLEIFCCPLIEYISCLPLKKQQKFNKLIGKLTF
jgi:hypothetical protein